MNAPSSSTAKNSHTPTPWTKDDKWGDLRSPDGKTIIVYGLGIGNLTSPDDESVANAAFIVRACNSHDALVAAARKLLANATFADGQGTILTHDAEDLEDALAAAGEGA